VANVNEKRLFVENEEPKHKKKSKAKGEPRSKHKHEYIPVLLHRPYHNTVDNTTKEILSVNKVCNICGRIDDSLNDEEWYDIEYRYISKYRIGEKHLNKKALKLPKWYTHDYFDKFAYSGE
jgi:hypothetical protein